jgi:hypothetical protein
VPRRPSLPACATVIALLGGCTVGATAAPASDTTPTTHARSHATTFDDARWIHRVDTIELDGESLSFERGSDLLGTGSLRDGHRTVAILTAMLGSPDKSTTQDGDGDACLPASTSYLWDGVLRVTQLAKRAKTGNELDVRLLSDTVPAKGGVDIALTGPDGIRVGQDIGDQIDGTPASDRVQLQAAPDEAWQIVLQEGWTDTDRGAEVNGVSALTDGTTVTVIGAPMPVHTTDAC